MATTPKIRPASEHEAFRVACARLQSVLDRRAALQAEFDNLLDDWRGAQAPAVGDVIDAAASGRDLPQPRSAHVESAVERRTRIAQEIAALDRAEPEGRRLVEAAREKARLAALAEHRAHVAELRDSWRLGLQIAAKAAAAEDALHARMVAAGLGLHEVKACDTLGIDRGRLVAMLTEPEAVGA